MRNIQINTIGQVCFIGDSQEFVEMMRWDYSGPHSVVTFTDPLDALARRRQDNRKLIQRDKNINDFFTEESVTRRFELAIDWLFDDARHDTVEIVFCDCSMPRMTGVELLRQIRTSRMRRILLTGISELEVPISAFNEGVIDTYIPKTAGPELLEAVNLLGKRGSRVAMDYLWRDLDPDINQALYDPAVIADVERILDAQLVVEHILLPNPAGFLCRTKDERCVWLQIETEDSLRGVVEILREEGWEQADVEPIISGQMTACVDAKQYAAVNGGHEHFQMAELHQLHGEKWLAVAAFDLPLTRATNS